MDVLVKIISEFGKRAASQSPQNASVPTAGMTNNPSNAGLPRQNHQPSLPPPFPGPRPMQQQQFQPQQLQQQFPGPQNFPKQQQPIQSSGSGMASNPSVTQTSNQPDISAILMAAGASGSAEALASMLTAAAGQNPGLAAAQLAEALKKMLAQQSTGPSPTAHQIGPADTANAPTLQQNVGRGNSTGQTPGSSLEISGGGYPSGMPTPQGGSILNLSMASPSAYPSQQGDIVPALPRFGASISPSPRTGVAAACPPFVPFPEALLIKYTSSLSQKVGESGSKPLDPLRGSKPLDPLRLPKVLRTKLLASHTIVSHSPGTSTPSISIPSSGDEYLSFTRPPIKSQCGELGDAELGPVKLWRVKSDASFRIGFLNQAIVGFHSGSLAELLDIVADGFKPSDGPLGRMVFIASDAETALKYCTTDPLYVLLVLADLGNVIKVESPADMLPQNISGYDSIYSSSLSRNGPMVGTRRPDHVIPLYLLHFPKIRKQDLWASICDRASLPTRSFSDVQSAGQEGIVDENDVFVCLWNPRPMFRVHFFVAPKQPVRFPDDLSQDYVPLLRDMEKFINTIIFRFQEEGDELEFGYGFHRLPTQWQLHCHVFSKDLPLDDQPDYDEDQFKPPKLVSFRDVIEDVLAVQEPTSQVPGPPPRHTSTRPHGPTDDGDSPYVPQPKRLASLDDSAYVPQPKNLEPVILQQPQAPYSGQQQQMPYAGQQPQVPYSGQQQQMPYAGQQPQAPYSGQQQMQAPYSGQQQQMSYAGQQPQMPYSGQQQQMPYAGQQPQAPYSGQQQQTPYSGQQQQMPYAGQQPQMPYSGQQQQMPYAGQQPQMPYSGQQQQMPYAGQLSDSFQAMPQPSVPPRIPAPMSMNLPMAGPINPPPDTLIPHHHFPSHRRLSSPPSRYGDRFRPSTNQKRRRSRSPIPSPRDSRHYSQSLTRRPRGRSHSRSQSPTDSGGRGGRRHIPSDITPTLDTEPFLKAVRERTQYVKRVGARLKPGAKGFVPYFFRCTPADDRTHMDVFVYENLIAQVFCDFVLLYDGMRPSYTTRWVLDSVLKAFKVPCTVVGRDRFVLKFSNGEEQLWVKDAEKDTNDEVPLKLGIRLNLRHSFWKRTKEDSVLKDLEGPCCTLEQEDGVNFLRCSLCPNQGRFTDPDSGFP